MPSPTPDQRLAERERPAGAIVGRQRWNHLLFAHWKVSAATVQATLPRGLHVDTFAGDAYLGIVPFFMQRNRPAWLPPLPWVSWFLELNVRTYVHDAVGRPGVWFYSLDCNQPIAVALARRFFHLPYHRARMTAERRGPSTVLTSQRRTPGSPACRYAWREGAGGTAAAPGSRDFFLVERYRLFAADAAGRLFTGRVHHAPYRLHVPAVTEFSAAPARPAGFTLAGEPDSLLAARPVDVALYPLSPVTPSATP
ncbi:MAG: DUF2071 domain-containing protein [bacterium]|nr:DUF2071 domain-containing protein [bacterium]MDI1336973.1 DUF2071 domain-containing protein [Lacunisphaera sp.]